MKVPKKIAVAGLTAAVGLSGIAGIGIVSAQASGGQSDLVAKIAEKFNLNQGDVQAVFDEEHAARQAERQAQISDHLQSLVDDGTITTDQKSAIEAKQAELKTQRESDRSELEAWASDNGIDLKYLRPAGMENDSSVRLQKAVDNGDITADQKSAIDAKLVELKTKHQAERDALDKWAQDNGIDIKYVLPRGPHGPGHGRGEMM